MTSHMTLKQESGRAIMAQQAWIRLLFAAAFALPGLVQCE